MALLKFLDLAITWEMGLALECVEGYKGVASENIQGIVLRVYR